MILTAVIKHGDGDRQRNAERTRTEILDVATAEFAHRGFAGARVDEIASLTTTTKRMIYYYFGGKKGLYIAVLERAIERVRLKTAFPEAARSDPLTLVRAIADLTFRQHEANPDFIRLMINEDIQGARHLAGAKSLESLAKPAMAMLDQALDEGARQGRIRPGVDAFDLFMIINSFCVFRVTNRFTFKQVCGRDMLDPSTEAHQRKMLGDMVIAYLTAASPHQSPPHPLPPSQGTTTPSVLPATPDKP